MFLMRADPLRGQVGGGWALEIETFWALWNGNALLGEFHLGPKKSQKVSKGCAAQGDSAAVPWVEVQEGTGRLVPVCLSQNAPEGPVHPL